MASHVISDDRHTADAINNYNASKEPSLKNFDFGGK